MVGYGRMEINSWTLRGARFGQLEALRNAPSQLQPVDPAEVGRGRIGHLGAFKPAESPLLWERLAQAVECVT